MPIEKVKIPKEVAEAIESVWSIVDSGSNKRHIVLVNWNYLFSRCSNKVVQKLLDYAHNNPLTYMIALVHDYEVEKTKEDLVREYFEECRKETVAFQDISEVVILKVLKMLDIKIEGVNDEN